jgi:hypothetical protein
MITKNTEMTLQETKEENESDAVDNYLTNFNKRKEVKDAPVFPDDNRIEVSTLRKSGRSSSPHRKSATNFQKYPRNFKESQDITWMSSLSSEESYIQQEQEQDQILEELNELYQVFLKWVFSSKGELDCSRPIRYSNIIPLCLNLAAKSTRLMKQKVISDFNFMTAVEKNSSIIMSERTFGRWILDLMYTVFPPKADFEKDPIWDMGWKLYIQMNKIWFNTDAEAHTYIHQLIVWPINKYLRQRSTNEK